MTFAGFPILSNGSPWAVWLGGQLVDLASHTHNWFLCMVMYKTQPLGYTYKAQAAPSALELVRHLRPYNLAGQQNFIQTARYLCYTKGT